MRRIQWVLIVIAAALILLVAYVLLAKPTLVLPTIVMVSPQNSAMYVYQKQLKITQLDVKLRTDGKVDLLGDGKDLATMVYNPVTLGNTIAIAKKVALPPAWSRALGYIPYLFPHLALNTFLTSQTIYFVLPIEMTVRFVQG
jgi:hypothetical protein